MLGELILCAVCSFGIYFSGVRCSLYDNVALMIFAAFSSGNAPFYFRSSVVELHIYAEFIIIPGTNLVPINNPVSGMISN